MSVEVSIIIVNYNTFQLTCNCIRSIREKTKEVDYEIILVDNASDEKEAKEFLNVFPGLNLIINKANIGFAKGNNVGILNANGAYCLLLNSDTELKNNAVKLALDHLKSSPLVGATSAKLLFPDGKLQHCCQRFPSIKNRLCELFRLQKLFPEYGGKILLGSFFKHDEVVFPDWIWGTFFLFRKDILKKFYGEKLPDDFFMYGEDMVWCKEIHKLGFKVSFTPDAEVIHYMGRSNGSKQTLMAQNYRLFMHTYYSAIHRWAIKFLDLCLSTQLK